MKRVIFWIAIIPAFIVAFSLGAICVLANYFICACMTLCDIVDELEWWSIGMEAADEYINNPFKHGTFTERVIKYWHDNYRPL